MERFQLAALPESQATCDTATQTLFPEEAVNARQQVKFSIVLDYHLQGCKTIFLVMDFDCCPSTKNNRRKKEESTDEP